MTRKALGRGLNALLHTTEEVPTSGLEQVAVDRIDPNPFQPRKEISAESLKELANSIRASGIVQPVLLRPDFPVDVPQVVAPGILPVLEKLDRPAEVRAVVHPGQETLDHAPRAEVQPGDSPDDVRMQKPL